MGTWVNYFSMDRESKENSRFWGGVLTGPDHCPLNPPRLSQQLSWSMALTTLYLLWLEICLTTPVAAQGLRGWHLCQSHFGTFHSTQRAQHLAGFIYQVLLDAQEKNIQSTKNKKLKPFTSFNKTLKNFYHKVLPKIWSFKAWVGKSNHLYKPVQTCLKRHICINV